MDPATTKFLAARPYAVLPISPALAAFYSSHSSYTEKNTQWCSKCGSYLLNGRSHVRIVRLKSRKGQPFRRVIRTVCQSCQHHVDATVDTEGPQIDVVSSNNVTPTSQTSSSISSPSMSVLPRETLAQGKVRHKKKSGLQLLLSKTRQKEMQESKSDATSESLATFLAGL